jgi:hypothetical protein
MANIVRMCFAPISTVADMKSGCVAGTWARRGVVDAIARARAAQRVRA